MFKFNKKSATSLAELLILLAIVGILSLMYQKYSHRDTLDIKIAYKGVLMNMAQFTANQSNTYTTELADRICNDFSRVLNTVGDINCGPSSIPDLPNVTTVNGMRFFGLENEFTLAPEGERYNIAYVDIDGLGGQNSTSRDILPFEILKNGHIRPSGAAVRVGGATTSLKGNPARDPEIFSVTAVYVPQDVFDLSSADTMAKGLSYAEAQCLTGNPFPYREASFPYNIQMCVENNALRNTINAAKVNPGTDTAPAMKTYWDSIRNGSICDNLYTDANSVAKGLTAANTDLVAKCKRCYKAAYKSLYCTTEPLPTECNAAIMDENGTCRITDYVE